ncbi:uncharacterized protein LOC126830589 [Patella vulgata]|uniref:uncharacterized protein LOC126830589 n=1 Tax=Patella vulgata TaxID=6465 RepID=UPI0024A835AB|nr:uncharacterized protein LOC126830589 [Patella vulgata]
MNCLKKCTTFKYIMVPINTGNHWIILVAKPKTKIVSVLNSLSSKSYAEALMMGVHPIIMRQQHVPMYRKYIAGALVYVATNTF